MAHAWHRAIDQVHSLSIDMDHLDTHRPWNKNIQIYSLNIQIYIYIYIYMYIYSQCYYMLVEKISWFSNTANVNRNTACWLQRDLNSHLRGHWSARSLYQLSYRVTGNGVAHLIIQFRCTRYSRDDFTLSVRIYSVSIPFHNYPQINMKRIILRETSLRVSLRIGFWDRIELLYACLNTYPHAFYR